MYNVTGTYFVYKNLHIYMLYVGFECIDKYPGGTTNFNELNYMASAKPNFSHEFKLTGRYYIMNTHDYLWSHT